MLQGEGAALRVRGDALACRHVGMHCGGITVWGCGHVGVRVHWRADMLTGEYVETKKNKVSNSLYPIKLYLPCGCVRCVVDTLHADVARRRWMERWWC